MGSSPWSHKESDMTEGLSKGQPKNQLFLSASHNGQNTCEVFFFTFYWRLITLQQSGFVLFCFVFPAKHQHESATGKHMFPLS